LNPQASWRRALPALVVFGCGLLLIALVVLLKPRPEPRPEPEAPLPVVNVVHAQPRTVTLPVQTQGTVAPRRQIELVSQVAGRIVEVAPRFVSGGFFADGEWLVRIDPRDYELALAAPGGSCSPGGGHRPKLSRTEAARRNEAAGVGARFVGMRTGD
jgi:multidrug efflux pump subunit AcrA (membrane-fusion protein)